MRLRNAVFVALVGGAVLAGCSDQGLADATEPNVIDTVTLGALRGSPVDIPSGYSVIDAQPVFTDRNDRPIEFVYDVDPVLGPVFVPAQAESLAAPSSGNPGLMPMDVPYDSITTAKSNGFIIDAPLPVDSGDVFMIRSGIRCSIGVPVYGKLEVRSIDTVANTITFRVLVNRSCGYRSLVPGVPKS